MTDEFDLNRFLEAQANTFASALREIKKGKKTGHWMWYVFPQYKGLGFSSMSLKYSIGSIEEAKSYWNHPVLGQRLIEITDAFFMLQNKTAYEVFGNPDHLKMQSCMTLFDLVQGESDLFSKVLDKYYTGARCRVTRAQFVMGQSQYS